MGRLPRRGGGRGRRSGSGPAASRTRRATSATSSPRPTWIDARRGDRRRRGDRAGRRRGARLRAAPGPASRPGLPGQSRFVYEVFDLLRLDGGRCSTSRSRRDGGSSQRCCVPIRASGSASSRGRRRSRSSRRRRSAGSRGSWRSSAARRTCRAAGRWPGRRSRSGPSRSSWWVAGRRVRAKAVGLGALLVGVYEDGALRYAGKVGAGSLARAAPSCRRRSSRS